MSRDPLYHRQRSNLFQTLLIAASLLGLMWLIGWLFAGIYGIVWATAVGVGPLLVSVRVLPALTLRFYGTRRLEYANAPPLFDMVADLSAAAGLAQAPVIHYIGSSAPLAFSTGTGADTVIALSDGLFRLLTFRELRGVIGHELSHIANRDTWVMSFADVTSRLTRMLSLIGQLLLFINLPLVFLSDHQLPWLPLLIMVFAPSLSALLQLALSRSREFEADLDCIRLTDDPAGLASALIKLERLRRHPLQQLFRPGSGDPEPSLLRTHPATEERINRLREYAVELQNHRQEQNGGNGVPLAGLPAVDRKPRGHLSGLWH